MKGDTPLNRGLESGVVGDTPPTGTLTYRDLVDAMCQADEKVLESVDVLTWCRGDVERAAVLAACLEMLEMTQGGDTPSGRVSFSGEGEDTPLRYLMWVRSAIELADGVLADRVLVDERGEQEG